MRRDDGRRVVTEADVEKAGDEEAQRLGALPVKGTFRGRRSWPDKFYFFPEARLLFVEYKRPGEEAEPDQAAVHRKLRRLGFQVLVIDDAEDAKAKLRRFAQGKKVDPEAA